jgi:hypothetical protein
MALLLDEIHVTSYAPRGLSPPKCDAIRQALDGARLRAALRRAARAILRRHPALAGARVTVTR